MKRCISCFIVKPRSDFNFSKQNKDGYRGQCRKCLRYFERERERNRPDAIRRRQAKEQRRFDKLVKAFEAKAARRYAKTVPGALQALIAKYAPYADEHRANLDHQDIYRPAKPYPPYEVLAERFELRDGVLYRRDWLGLHDKSLVGQPAGSRKGKYMRIDMAYPSGMHGTRKLAYHRIVWVLHHGTDPYPHDIDHIDGNPLNNRPENLRLTNSRKNVRNIPVEHGCHHRGDYEPRRSGQYKPHCVRLLTANGPKRATLPDMRTAEDAAELRRRFIEWLEPGLRPRMYDRPDS